MDTFSGEETGSTHQRCPTRGTSFTPIPAARWNYYRNDPTDRPRAGARNVQERFRTSTGGAFLQPLFDSLSSMLETSTKAALTVVDRTGCPYTRSMRVMSSPFRGQLWLTAGIDETPIEKIGGGAEVSVACGSETGPYAIICGWAVVLRNRRYAKMSARADPHRVRASNQELRPVVCVTARAAQMWEAAAQRPRVFAFSHAEPIFLDDSVALQARPPQARAGELERAG